MADRRRVLLVGGGDLAEEVCEALEAGGARRDLARARRRRVAARRARARSPDVVCVATRDDAFPLRIALLVRHLDEDVPLLVTIFDPGIAKQIARDDPELPRDLGRRHRRAVARRAVHRPGPAGGAARRRADRRARRVAGGGRAAAAPGAPRAQPRHRRAPPYDRSAALLFYGFAGLVAMLVLRVVRRDDRARPGVRRRALRLDQVARHGRAEHGGRRRAEVVQGRDRAARWSSRCCRPPASPAA